MILPLTNRAIKKPSLSSTGSVRSKCSATTKNINQMLHENIVVRDSENSLLVLHIKHPF